MSKDTARQVAMILGVVTALFFMSAAFDILPSNIGIFLGIAASLVTGLVWSLAGRAGE